MFCNCFNFYGFIINHLVTLGKESCIIYLASCIWNVSCCSYSYMIIYLK